MFAIPKHLTFKVLELNAFNEEKVEEKLSGGEPIEIVNKMLGYNKDTKAHAESELCNICGAMCPIEKAGIIMPCGHVFHLICVITYSKKKIEESLEILCPACKVYMPLYPQLEEKLTPSLLQNICNIEFNAYCNLNKNIVRCPKCKTFIKKIDGYKECIDCQCGKQICSLCKNKWHFPLSCAEKEVFKDLFNYVNRKNVSNFANINKIKADLIACKSEKFSLMIKNISFCKNVYIYSLFHEEVTTFKFIEENINKMGKILTDKKLNKDELVPIINSINTIKMNFHA
jgi:hypothetical protein